jgi:DNA replication protein DnaC
MCPICQDTKWKTVIVAGVERVDRCDCWRDVLVGNLLNEARIPSRFGRVELDSYIPDTDSQRDALRRSRAFVEAFPAVDRGLLFFGPSGVGKTHLAAGVLKGVIRRGARGYFFETRELLRLVRDTYNRSADETEMEVLQPVLDADVMVLDDLGAERTSEWVKETLGLVINTRYNARRATIVTSNLADLGDSTDPNSFRFQIGERSRSRLLEMCHWVEVSGSDVRDQDAVTRAARSGQVGADPGAIKKGLPAKGGGMARARLRQGQGQLDLNWTGGKAGTK